MFSPGKIDEFIHGLVGDGVTPSLCISIVDHEKVLYRNAVGKKAILPYEEDVDYDTLYDMASISKIVQTTMLACRLIDEGRLSLDTRISDVLDNPGRYGSATVLDLMTHRGGFIPEMRLWNYVDTPRQAIDFILDQEPIYEIGKSEAYSCFGYIILGVMLEKVTGLRLDEAARRYVYEPLGMTHTLSNPLEKGIENIASTEIDELTGKVIRGVVHDENARFLGGVAGNAGVFSTLDDMEKLMKMILCRGLLEDGTRFLSEDIIDMFYRNFTPGMPESRGLGFFIGLQGNPPIHIGGSFVGFGHTGFTGPSIWIVPEMDRAVTVLANRVHPTRNERRLIEKRKDLHDLVFQ